MENGDRRTVETFHEMSPKIRRQENGDRRKETGGRRMKTRV
jgi:hypothetical protein